MVHDYGYYPTGSYSVNATHSCTSVRYLKTKEVLGILDDIKWYIKGDLKDGFRQFGTHPVDWKYQVYCNGVDEHYIDLACPFGKTNSTLEFCPPVALLAKSLAQRYAYTFKTAGPVLGTHVDNIFGGFKRNLGLDRAIHFRRYMCETSMALSMSFNMKLTKTPPPALVQVILGRKYNSHTRRVVTAEDKRLKYLRRLRKTILDSTSTRRELEKLHGNLNYVANIEPFGRPFLAHITSAI